MRLSLIALCCAAGFFVGNVTMLVRWTVWRADHACALVTTAPVVKP